MSGNHAKYKFSTTVQTEDFAVLHCLRSLCQMWAGGPTPQTGWGGTDEASWRSKNNKAVLRFTSVEGRASIEKDAKRLLSEHWVLVSRSDNDPAQPRR
jgi:hypothetical protein